VKGVKNVPILLRIALVQKIQKRRTLWKYGKGSAFTTFPQYGGRGVMSRGSVREEKQTIDYIPDISTLLRIGHFYFALTIFVFLVAPFSWKW
jgi:hypothetical protein